MPQNRFKKFIQDNWKVILYILVVLFGIFCIYRQFDKVTPGQFTNLSIGAALAFFLGVLEFIKDYRQGTSKSWSLTMIILSTLGFLYSIYTSAESKEDGISANETNTTLQNQLTSMEGKVDSVKISQRDAKEILTALTEASSKVQSTADLIKERTDRSIYITDSVTRSQMRIRRSMDEQRMYSAYQLLIWTYDEALWRLKDAKDLEAATVEFHDLLPKIKSVLVGELNNEIMTSNPYVEPIWNWMNHQLAGWIANPQMFQINKEGYDQMLEIFTNIYCYFKKQIFSYYTLNNERFEYNKEAETRLKKPKWGISIGIIKPHVLTPIPPCK